MSGACGLMLPLVETIAVGVLIVGTFNEDDMPSDRKYCGKELPRPTSCHGWSCCLGLTGGEGTREPSSAASGILDINEEAV